MKRLARTLLAVVAIGCVWEAFYRAGILNPIIFAAPSLILQAIVDDGWTFATAFRLTIMEIGIALLVAWTLGVGFGIVAGASDGLARFTAPLLSALIAVPLVVLYPLVIASIGLGPDSKVIFGVLSGIFPIALNTLVGVRGLDPGYARMASAMGASRAQIRMMVLAPLALPSIISGLRLGTALIIIGVVLSEMLGSTDGLGFWISYHRSLFNTGRSIWASFSVCFLQAWPMRFSGSWSAASLATPCTMRIEGRYPYIESLERISRRSFIDRGLRLGRNPPCADIIATSCALFQLSPDQRL